MEWRDREERTSKVREGRLRRKAIEGGERFFFIEGETIDYLDCLRAAGGQYRGCDDEEKRSRVKRGIGVEGRTKTDSVLLLVLI